MVSQGVMKDSHPDLDEWRNLFEDDGHPGPEWTIESLELYWRDCTIWASVLTTKTDRLADHAAMHHKIRAFRQQYEGVEAAAEAEGGGVVPAKGWCYCS